MSQQAFINSVKNGAIQGWHTHKILASLTIAQAILESGWGSSSLSKPPNNNLFGIKASDDWTGEVVRMPTQEWNGSQMVTVYADFRKYSSASESILNHSAFFTNTEWRKNNYRAVIGEKDYRQACYAVSQAGYATDPNYPGKLINLIESYNLNRYDQEAFNGNAPPIVIPEPIEKPEPGGSDPGRSVEYSLFDTRNYVNVSKINYKDDMLISPEGESVIYNPTLNDQFVFTPRGAETMWIDQIYESNVDNYIVLMEEAINFMRERSKPEAQYTVNMKYLPDSISIGDTGQFIDHEYNPPLYIEARVLDIITSETEPEMDSVIIGNVTEIKSRYQAELLELQERLKKTREGLLDDFYKAGEPEVFIDASNGTSLSVTGTKEKKELISARLSVTEVAESYEYEIRQPEDEASEWLFFTGRILDNVIDHSEELPLGIIEANNIVTLSDDLPENPQGEDVPYIDPALDLKELDVEQFTLELINDNGAVVQTSSVPVRIDSYFSIPVKKTSQTIDKISIKSNKAIDIENISFAEPSRATKESEFTVLTARIMQNGKDTTERYGNYRWTRISDNVALDDIWNERNKFAQDNSLTVYPSDVEGENSTFICRVYDGLNFVAGGSTAVTVVKDGETTYFHRAWADDLEGGGFTLDESLNKKFMGTYSSFDPVQSQNYQDYQWQRMAEDYAKEFEGIIGTKGEPTYNKNRLVGPTERTIAKGEATLIEHNGKGYELGDEITISMRITCLVDDVITWEERTRTEVVPFIREIEYRTDLYPEDSYVERAGVMGSATYTWEVELINGELTGNRTEEIRTDYIAPVNELFIQGTKQSSNLTLNFTADDLLPAPTPKTKSEVVLNLIEPGGSLPPDPVEPVEPGESQFTNARVVNLADYGGIGDASTDNFNAFQQVVIDSVDEPLVLEIDSGTYDLRGADNQRLEAWPNKSKGLRIVGKGDVVIRHKNNRTNQKHEYYFMQLAMTEDSLGFEVENITLDGIRNPQEELFYTQSESNPISNIPMTRGFAVNGAHNVLFNNVTFKNMYGGYGILVEEYRNVNITNTTFDKVGGNDIQESFGMAIYLGGHTGDAVVNIDNVHAQGMTTHKDLRLSWIGVVLENGTIQSSDPTFWMRDKNTTVNITNSSFIDYQSTFHVESVAGNVYWNVDNLETRASNYQIVAGVYGEYKEVSNNVRMDMVPYGRLWGIVKGLYYSEAQELEDNWNGHNMMNMHNSVINLIKVDGFDDPVQAVAYGSNVTGRLHNCQINDLPHKLVSNGSALLYNSEVNLAQGSNETRQSLQNGNFSDASKQRVEFNNTNVNPYGSHKNVIFGPKPNFAKNEGFVPPFIDLPIQPPI